MYNIKLEVDKPDVKGLEERVRETINDGIRITDNIDTIIDNLTTEKAKSLRNLGVYGIKNPNSSQEVITYLKRKSVDDPNIELYCKDDFGKWSSKADNMTALAHAGNEFALDLLVYRRIKKYIETLVSLKSFRQSDGMIRPVVSVGKTGRINYSDPALMNIPKKMLWDTVVPSDDNNVLVSVDIKNQEPWILINMLNIQSLKEALKDDSEGGLYNSMFRLWFGHEPTPLQRSEFKTAWNALTYGSTKKAVTERCKNIDGAEVYKKFNGIQELKEYSSECYKKASKGDRTAKTLFGREVYADAGTKSSIQRQLRNLPIQGTGVDILALLVKHFEDTVEELGLVDKIWLYYTRHDEVILEVDGDYFNSTGEDKVIEMLRDIFEHKIDDWESFKVEIGRVKPTGFGMDVLQDCDEDM